MIQKNQSNYLSVDVITNEANKLEIFKSNISFEDDNVSQNYP